jgi:acetoin utilization deacetylase AcuC-like enzyme
MITIYFRPEMVAENAGSFSPSASKPGLVMDRWSQLGIDFKVKAPSAFGNQDLAAGHDISYVNGVMSLKKSNGFGNFDKEVARSLRYTNASFYYAAKSALKTGGVAVSPTSGFHHAGHDHGGGFCTFNGLTIAAKKLHDDGLVKRVAILDCDEHYGNGTDDVIKKLDMKWIRHFTVGACGYHGEDDGAIFLATLPKILDGFRDCDVLFYQAGADCHIDDPLGGFMTTEQMQERDRIVFEWARDNKVPVTWNLAGGYQKPIENVLDLHENTMRVCAEVYGEIGEEKNAS